MFGADSVDICHRCCNVVFDVMLENVRQMRENVEFDKAGEPQWRFHRFSTGSRSFRYGIGRLVGRTVHFRNGDRVAVPDGYKREESTW